MVLPQRSARPGSDVLSSASSPDEARIVIEMWRRRHNTKRPHSSLGYRPPAPEVVPWPAPPYGFSCAGRSAQARHPLKSNPDHPIGQANAPFGLLISAIFAAAAMSLSSVSVIANALRLRTVRLEA